jgi:hypothetical protein
LDEEFLTRLGRFDVVYSWGVLHHTGEMFRSLKLASACVKPGGLFVFALYRKTQLCWAWKIEKRWYAAATPVAQRLARGAFIGLMQLPPSFKSGQAVELLNGPFADVSGLFEEARDHNRVVLLLSLLGRKVRVEAPIEEVIAAV